MVFKSSSVGLVAFGCTAGMEGGQVAKIIFFFLVMVSAQGAKPVFSTFFQGQGVLHYLHTKLIKILFKKKKEKK